MDTTSTLTEAHIAYLLSQRLGRLATVAPDGAPQNSPIGFKVNKILGTLDIRGYNMGTSRKFRNVEKNPHVSLVVDDIASVDPWRVRGVEIRGTAEALRDIDTGPGTSREMIRIHPVRVIAWGLDGQ